MKNIKILIFVLFIPVFVFSQSASGGLPKLNPKNFTFTVLGDRTGSAKQLIFEQVLKTIKAINPNFVINVGDLIEGYSQNIDTLNYQWDGIFANLGNLKSKFYFTPGNHDAFDSLNASIYLSRVGYEKPYYTFSVGKNHFVVLDNARQEKFDQFDSTQVRWLNTQLSKYKKSDNIFCFMHRSYWKYAYANNKPDTFHKLFVKYGVDYVFSGHDHFYCQLIWDGITYTQVGPSGSRYKVYFDEAYGAFQNFLLVSVKNDKVQIRVIRPDGGELPADYVTYDDIEQLKNIEQSIRLWRITSVVADKAESIYVTIKNIYDQPISITGKWSTDNSIWHITPEETSITISAQQTDTYAFWSKVDHENIYPLPQFTVVYPYRNYQKNYSCMKILPLKITTDCYKTGSPITVDGILNEKIWSTIKPLTIFGSSDGGISQTDPWEVSFTYDKTNLYISARMTDYEPDKISLTITERDDRVYNDDHINIILQPKVESDTYYQFFINANGVILDRVCYMVGNPPKTDSRKDTKWDGEIDARAQIITGEKFTGWILEMAIPFKQFAIEDLSQWGFNLVRYQKRVDDVSIYSIPFEHNPKTFASLKFSEQ